MNKRFTKLIAALALLVFMMPSLVAWGQTRVEESLVALTFPDDNSSNNGLTQNQYLSTWTAMIDDYSWSISNFNNNNWSGDWTYIKCGRKNNASVANITTSDAYPEAVTKVSITIDAITTSKVNSITLFISSDGSSWTSAGNYTKSTGVQTVTLANPTADQYYKIEFDCQSGSSNGLVTVSKVEYFYDNPSGTLTCEAPTFNPAAGTYTEAQSIEINCATESATIYYTTDGNDPTTNSTVYSGAINVSTYTTIKAMAVAEGYNNSAVATAVYNFVTIEHAGTEADPYTVADARAAIDANVGTQGVYATGIVCTASPQLYQSKYLSYYISADGLTTSDQLEAYNGLSFDGASFTSKDDVQVGDEVVIYGNLTKHNTTYEFAQDNVLVSLVRPQNPSITVTPATINAPFAGAEGTLTVTYENITTVVADVYFCNAAGTEATYDWVTASVNETTNNVDYLIEENEGEARTAYLKVWAYDDDMNEVYSDIVTINQAEYVAPTYAELPFEFNSGKAAIEETDGLSQEGLGSDYSTDNTKLKFDHTGDWLLLQFNERPGTLTFDIKNNSFSGGTFTVQTSEDGVTYTDLETYTEITGTQNEEFTDLGENVRYIKWVYTNKSSGNVGLGNIVLAKYEAPVPAITVESTTITATAAETEGTLNVTYTAIETSLGASIYWYTDATGVTVTDEPEWVSAEINETTLAVDYIIAANEGDARTAYFKVYALDDEANEVYSDLVTVSQAAYVAPFEPATYTLATSIESGKTYIIVNQEFSKAMGAQNDNNRAAADVTIQDQTITVTSDAVYEFVIESVSEGIYCIYDDRAAGFLYAASSSSNYLKTKAELDDNGNWAISIEDGVASIVAQGTNSRKVMQYNSGSTLFSCYGSASQKPVYLYVKEEETPEPETYELTINGYTDAESKAGYYLIASPVTVNIADVDGLTEGDFDLYSYDESQELEWINYKQEDGSHPFTTLEPGKGYLYAKKATAETSTYTFTLTGTPYYGTPIVLSKQSTGTLAGWNLIGNPLATSNIAPGRAFYIMNSTIGELIASESNTVEPMQGFFVIADEDGEEFELTVPLGGDGNLDKLVMNLSQNRGNVIDRAIVRFDEGDQLPKFQLNPNNTKLYIAQGNKDYAVVRSAAQGEMPVSFRAAENGTYTLSIETENVEMDYLHLIDNMTGMDVDLLATPNYTFEAKTSDYASRFRLVFSANGIDEQNAETFAFFNGSEWMVSNLGEATLQVVDVMGRVLSTETISGNAELSLNQPAGVYMLRLINGNDVKVQKVVVR